MTNNPNSGVRSTVQHHGESPHISKRGTTNYKKVPWCIYFDYIQLSSDMNLKIRRYSYAQAGSEIDYDDVPNLLARLTLNARRPEHEQFPWPEAYDAKNRVWRRKSYYAIVIDHPTFGFIQGQDGIIIRNNNSEANYTLYDGQVKSIQVGTGQCSAFYCINHFKKDRGGNDHSSSDPLYYDFELNTNLPEGIRYPDSGGTNTGPPIGPP